MFSFEDTNMVRYEMVREWIATDQTAEQVVKKYGYTRSRLYVNSRRIQEEGVSGVIDKKRGPKGPTKATPDVQRLIINIRKRDGKAVDEIAKELKEKHGVSISMKTVDTILSQHKISKKKRGRKPKQQY